jgi:hypothetical protein
MAPDAYERWRRCIPVGCVIALTPSYAAEPVLGWNDERAEETMRFRRLYGDRPWRALSEWFERALREVAVPN